MRPISRLQLPISIWLSVLALLTICHPRLTPGSFITTVDPEQASLDIGTASSVQRFKREEGSAAATSLRPRSLGFHQYLSIGNGWNMYYSSWPSIALPIQPAAWALTNIYASLLLQARGKWAKNPPEHSITLTYCGIRILMHCPQRPIPWLFVENFAEKMLQMTEAGWTGVYQVMLSQAETDVSIGVHLSVVG